MNNETKWTKGPWRHALRNASEIMTTFHGVQIGRIYIDVTTDNEAGDAHLIAAPPELYEALEWAMRFVEQVRAESPAPKGGGEDIAYREAQAALAKARGES